MDGRMVMDERNEFKPKKKRLAVSICIGLGILFVLWMIAAMCISIWSAVKRAERQLMPDYGYDYGAGGYYGYGDPGDGGGYFGYGAPDGSGSQGDDYGYYTPGPDDEYYRELTDAIPHDLSYDVVWQSVSLRPDDPEDKCSYDCAYPVLTGEEKEKLNRVNAGIEEMACEYKTVFRDYDAGVVSYGYVTYMDEDKISVVIRHTLDDGKQAVPIVRALTFRMDTGEVIPHSDMAKVDEYLVHQFRIRSTYQNGTVEAVDELSDEELRVCLQDEKDSIMFYTPVGLELGFNYKGGWVTVTLKNHMI